ncbi:MAG: sulfite exporter TauE/SafE family protein [Gemmatimonadetes bacterium]|nr:sulfite exporter TauE/SafE family protein [Gemmatimonadota bacterium]
MTPKAWLFLLLGLFVAYYSVSWVRGASLTESGQKASADPTPAGSPIPKMVLYGMVGMLFGWISGGGVQVTDWVVTFTSPFGATGTPSMYVAIATMTFLGAAIGLVFHKGRPGWPKAVELFIGFITNFFDTLGIGSYAPTTAMWKAWKMVDDRVIPGTLTAGHFPSTIAQAFIFIAIVEVDFKTLTLLILAAVLGAWLGAGVVATWSKRNVQLGMGLALLAAAALFVIKNVDEMRGTPMIAGGTALSLAGVYLMVGIVGNFILGALMTIGVGAYAPSLIMISLLGMNPTAAFPIMMGSCAFLMPIASGRFVKKGSFALRPALGLTLAGVPAVLLAAIIVKSLPLTTVRWLVVVVVLYTSVSMLRSARAERIAAKTG